MTAAGAIGGWREIREEARRRIAERVWAPGETVPHESALAEEFGVARPTVNRAMRALAEEGLIERRRKAGTRVAETPRRRARAVIPLIREEIEAADAAYGYALIGVRHGRPPEEIRARFAETAEPKLMHVAALHLADGAPWVLDRARGGERQRLGFARTVTPEAWLSTWSGASSRANVVANAAGVRVPVLMVHADRDREIYPITDVAPMRDAFAGNEDFTFESMDARHYFEPEDPTAKDAPDVEALMDRLIEWTREHVGG